MHCFRQPQPTNTELDVASGFLGPFLRVVAYIDADPDAAADGGAASAALGGGTSTRAAGSSRFDSLGRRFEKLPITYYTSAHSFLYWSHALSGPPSTTKHGVPPTPWSLFLPSLNLHSQCLYNSCGLGVSTMCSITRSIQSRLLLLPSFHHHPSGSSSLLLRSSSTSSTSTVLRRGLFVASVVCLDALSTMFMQLADVAPDLVAGCKELDDGDGDDDGDGLKTELKRLGALLQHCSPDDWGDDTIDATKQPNGTAPRPTLPTPPTCCLPMRIAIDIILALRPLATVPSAARSSSPRRSSPSSLVSPSLLSSVNFVQVVHSTFQRSCLLPGAGGAQYLLPLRRVDVPRLSKFFSCKKSGTPIINTTAPAPAPPAPPAPQSAVVVIVALVDLSAYELDDDADVDADAVGQSVCDDDVKRGVEPRSYSAAAAAAADHLSSLGVTLLCLHGGSGVSMYDDDGDGDAGGRTSRLLSELLSFCARRDISVCPALSRRDADCLCAATGCRSSASVGGLKAKDLGGGEGWSALLISVEGISKLHEERYGLSPVSSHGRSDYCQQLHSSDFFLHLFRSVAAIAPPPPLAGPPPAPPAAPVVHVFVHGRTSFLAVALETCIRRCVSVLLSALLHGRLLPGGGVTEVLVAMALGDAADMCMKEEEEEWGGRRTADDASDRDLVPVLVGVANALEDTAVSILEAVQSLREEGGPADKSSTASTREAALVEYKSLVLRLREIPSYGWPEGWWCDRRFMKTLLKHPVVGRPFNSPPVLDDWFSKREAFERAFALVESLRAAQKSARIAS